MRYNNDLKVVSTSGPKVGAKLSYLSVSPKEQAGPTISSSVTTETIGTSSKSIGVSIPKTGAPTDYTFTRVQGYSVPTTANALGTGTNTNTPSTPVATIPTYEGTTGNLNDDVPTVTKNPPSDGHTHSAYDIWEEKTRIWFTPDERQELRDIILSMNDLEALKTTVDALKDGMANADNTPKVMVFVIPGPPVEGPQQVEIRFPFDGTLVSMQANCNIAGIAPMDIFVDTCSKVTYSSNGEWTQVGTVPLELPITSRYSEVLDVNLDVHADDMFRVRLGTVPQLLDTVTVEILFQTKHVQV